MVAYVRWTLLAALALSACSDEDVPDAGRDAGIRDAAGSERSDASRDAAGAPADARRDASGDAGTAAREAASVFFVGHSLVNFDMPAMLEDLAAAAGREHQYGAQVGIGAPLWWNWEHPDTADGDDAYLELPTGRYDVLVLTELIPIREHFMYSETVEYASRFAQLALDARPSTQIYVYETWYDHGDPAFLENIASDRAIWEQIADELDARVGGPEVLLVPAGTAMARLVERMEAGGVDGLTSRGQLFVDAIHLNDVGNYFVALVQFATIYRTSPEGLPHQTTDRFGAPFDAPSPAAARVMQEIAWDVVSHDPRTGVAR